MQYLLFENKYQILKSNKRFQHVSCVLLTACPVLRDFQCPDERCIPAIYHCDGFKDCDQAEDEQNCPSGFLNLPLYTVLLMVIVGNNSTFFRYTSYLPWAIWQTKNRFYEYTWGRGDQSSSNEIACYNKILFNLNDVILGFSYLK